MSEPVAVSAVSATDRLLDERFVELKPRLLAAARSLVGTDTAEDVVQLVPPVSGTCPWIPLTGIGANTEEELMYGEFEYLSAELFLDGARRLRLHKRRESQTAAHPLLIPVGDTIPPN